MKTIMVQMSNEQWTMEAMHLASALARSTQGKVVLLHLVLANNAGLLGWGIPEPTDEEQHFLEEYDTVAEDYGVEFCVQPMQYISLTDALAQAVDSTGASILFANIPDSRIPFWKQFRFWNLKHRLHNCRLYTLDEEQPISIDEPTPVDVGERG